MNHAIIGKPRNGKGRFCMGMLIDELRESDRIIITNFAVEKFPWVTSDHKTRRGLVDYLLATYGKTFNCTERIFRLTDEAIEHYYLYRGLTPDRIEAMGDEFLKGFREVTREDGVLVESEWEKHKKIKLYVADNVKHDAKNGRKVCDSYNTALASASGGHVNVIDECWKFWPARGWSNTGDALHFHFAQVGKFTDDTWLMTHRINDCDSILMDKCQDWYVCTNHGKLNFGLFRQPSVITVCVYATKPTPSAEPQFRKVLKLDKGGVCECFDTSAGVGVTGRVMADVGRKSSGLPIWLIPIIGIALIVAMIYGVKFGVRYISGVFKGNKKPVALAVTNAVASASGSAAVPTAVGNVASVPPVPVHNMPLVDTNEIGCVGWAVVNGGVHVFLTDGTTAESEFGEVDFIDVKGRRVGVSGKVYRRVKRPAFTDAPRYEQQLGPVASLYSRPDPPVNDVIIGPTIHGAGGSNPPQRLNGIGSMQRQFAGAVPQNGQGY